MAGAGGRLESTALPHPLLAIRGSSRAMAPESASVLISLPAPPNPQFWRAFRPTFAWCHANNAPARAQCKGSTSANGAANGTAAYALATPLVRTGDPGSGRRGTQAPSVGCPGIQGRSFLASST